MSGDVHLIPSPPARSTNGIGGNGYDSGLRHLEVQIARIDERVKAIQENMAQKNDVISLKVWILGGVLSAIIVGAGIAATVSKVFL